MMESFVLVVDDDRDIRDSLVELLEEHGYRAKGASNGLEALDQLRESPEPPFVILLDLMMPLMDGREFRERQLEEPAWAGIPVIAISAYSDIAAQADSLGVEFLRKPLAVRPLLDRLRRFAPGDHASS